MLAVGLDYARRLLTHRDVPPPEAPGPGEVLFRVRGVGVCGTDRELAAFDIGYAPAGSDWLTLGHEAAGEVVAVGEGVTGLAPGDWVAPMIRRACQRGCRWCAAGRRDLCETATYCERGIYGLDGYFAELAVDRAEDLVPVPNEIADVAVLVEPLSVVEKAVERLLASHPGEPRHALVLGAGPIGILSALVLQSRGLRATVHSLEPEGHPRARLLDSAGVVYTAANPDRADVVIEATGSDQAAAFAVERLAPNGVCCLLGSRGEARFAALRLIVENLLVFGSVNASPQAFRAAVADLGRLDRRILDSLLRRVPWRSYAETIPAPPGDSIKLVHVFAG